MHDLTRRSFWQRHVGKGGINLGKGKYGLSHARGTASETKTRCRTPAPDCPPLKGRAAQDPKPLDGIGQATSTDIALAGTIGLLGIQAAFNHHEASHESL